MTTGEKISNFFMAILFWPLYLFPNCGDGRVVPLMLIGFISWLIFLSALFGMALRVLFSIT